MSARCSAVSDTAHVAQPRADPQADAADEGELLDGQQGLDAPVEAVGQDDAGDAELLAQRGPAPRASARSGTTAKSSADGRKADAGQPEEQALPARHRQRPLDRPGRRHRADAAGHHVEAGDQAPAMRRIPQREDLDRGHQAAGEADADQHAGQISSGSEEPVRTAPSRARQRPAARPAPCAARSGRAPRPADRLQPAKNRKKAEVRRPRSAAVMPISRSR